MAAANCLPFQNRSSPSSLSERDRVIHLLSRATYGVRPLDVEQAMQMGRKEWLEKQLHPEAIPDLTLDARIAARPDTPTNPLPAELAPVVPPPLAPGQMPNAIGPDVDAVRALTQMMATARQQLEALQNQLSQAQRAMTQAQASANEQDLAAARRGLEGALSSYQLSQQQMNNIQRNFDAVMQRMNAMTNQPTPMPNAAMPQLVRARVLGSSLQSINVLVGSKVERAVFSERQLEEVMTDFWFNHFNLYFNKGQVRQAIADYEQNAIRKHVFGRFEDLLVATAQHPAMLVYLDNFQSTAVPAQTASSNTARALRLPRGGLNENYARELMELHTLGVDGGYTQQDVINVARAFTGWGIASRPGTIAGATPGAPATPPTLVFQFHANQHDTGDKVVLGQTITGGRGVDEGMEVLRMLARNPATARHVATKLVSHFVSDDPPEALVEQIARVFLETDGDLREVTRALFLSSEFYNPDHYRAKVKRPFEFIVSTLRATGADFTNNGPWIVTQLRSFRHLPYSEAAPTGYATTAEDWVSAGAMLARMNFGLDLAGGRLQGVTLGQAPGGVTNTALQIDPSSTVQSATGGATPTPELQSAVRALLQQVQVGAQTDELAALIADDLTSLPAQGVGIQQGAGTPGTLQTGRLLGGTPPARAAKAAPGLVVQRRGPNTQPLSAAMRALGLALGSPEFQRY